MLAAGDTFRAGAIDQLQVWGEGSDPALQLYMMQLIPLK